MRYKTIIFATALIILNACKFKNPEDCITGPSEVEPGSTHVFSYCGDIDKIERISWSLNGEEYEGTSVEITFPSESEIEYLPLEYYINIQIDRHKSNWKGNTLDWGRKNTQHSVVISNPSPSFYIECITDDLIPKKVENASVTIYKTEDCFKEKDTNLECSEGVYETDENGIAIIEDLDPTASYIIEVIGDDYRSSYFTITDWASEDGYGGYSVGYGTINNSYQAYIYQSAKEHLASASLWRLTDIKDPNSGVSAWDTTKDCLKDDYMMFLRNDTWTYFDGIKCTPTNEFSGTYDLNFQTQITNYGFNLIQNDQSTLFGTDEPYGRMENEKLIIRNTQFTKEYIFTRE